MNKYLQLMKNILILGIGSFASKLVSYALLPLYTSILTTEEYGIAELLSNTANLLIPIISLCMSDAVVRFSMENRRNRRDAYSAGISTFLMGYAVFLLLWPVMTNISLIQEYIWLVYLFVLTAALNGFTGLFARCIGYMRLYAYAGFQNTLLMVGFNLLFLLVFKMGLVGYVLSTILADLITFLFIFIVGNLKRYLRFTGLNRALWKVMLRFSIPLIPNTLFWWITNLSDRYLIGYLMADGESMTGIYGIACKIPNFVTLVSTIFMQAWQLSAIEEYNNKDKVRFYSQVFTTFQVLVFTTASLLMLLVRPIMSVLVAENFYIAWQYVPFLLLGVSFQCFVNFFSTLYIAAKRSIANMLTTMVGAVSNIVLNFLLIPVWGIQGAAFATFVSFFLVFIVRSIDCRRTFGVTIQPFRLVLNTVLVLAQTLVTVFQPQHSVAYESVLFVLILLCNIQPLLSSAKRLWRMLSSRMHPKNRQA